MILDATIGSRKIYRGLDKRINGELIGIDVRKGDFSIDEPTKWAKQEVIIKPTILADMKYLPFKAEAFHLIVFDPPHTEAGLNSWLYNYYGSWTEHERILTLRKANKEFARVLKQNGFLILKVMPDQLQLTEYLLNNFTFFLPIYTYRSRGSYSDPQGKQKGAIWAIGLKNPVKEVLIKDE